MLRMRNRFLGCDLIWESMIVVASHCQLNFYCQLVLHCHLTPRCQILPCFEHLAVKGGSLVVGQLLWNMFLLQKFSCCEFFFFLCRLWPMSRCLILPNTLKYWCLGWHLSLILTFAIVLQCVRQSELAGSGPRGGAGVKGGKLHR